MEGGSEKQRTMKICYESPEYYAEEKIGRGRFCGGKKERVIWIGRVCQDDR
jgi:hypothetical protein